MFLKRWFQKIKSRARQGKAFEAMTRAALKRLADDPKNNFWFMRLFDYRSFIRLNPKFFAFKQPADFIACANGRFYLIECKSSQANRFDPKNFKSHQEAAMREMSEKKGKYWLLVLHRENLRTNNEAFAFNYMQWLQLKLEIRTSKFSTADWALVKTFATLELHRVSGVWDLKPLFLENNKHNENNCVSWEDTYPDYREEDMR